MIIVVSGAMGSLDLSHDGPAFYTNCGEEP